MPDKPISRWLGIALLLVIATVFGANHVAARVAMDHGANVTTAVAVRSGGTVIFVLALLLLGGVPLRLPRARLGGALAIGALLALGAALVRTRAEGRLPRDMLGVFAVVASFMALAFVLSGVLAPGGPWMFFELFVIVAVVVFNRSARESDRWIGYGTLGLLAAMLIFRLWISWQGSENRWALMSVEIPILSWLP
ncbi:MAG: hypothetical protein ACRETX_16555, partial [Steroidobacteraceae bacterium]